MIKENTFTTKSSGITVKLPLFIPVYRPDHAFELFSEESGRYGLGAVMVNAFLLFREQRLKTAFEQGRTLREHIGGFEGMLCTDSGAFQQLGGRKVNIDPLEIAKFQNAIKTDIAAPLDLITPPDTSYEETNRRMVISQYRIEEALEACDFSDLAGIQQGGGFFSLRQKHIRQLAAVGTKYYGIGSMVPFFNRNHDLSFTCGVISDARSVIGESAPMHVYGAGDPLDIAFMFYAGANIFDSSSYAHYAQRGYYMTPYGAVGRRAACEQLDFVCSCPVCSGNDMAEIFDKERGEPLRKRHNLFMILETVRALGEASRLGRLEEHVFAVYDKHVGNVSLFPGSMLAASWEKYLKGETPESAQQGVERSGGPGAGTAEAAVGGPAGSGPAAFSGIEKEVLSLLAAESAAMYKMEESAISGLLAAEMRAPGNAHIRSRIGGAGSVKEALRLSEYKAFRKNIRARVYQTLRQYKPTGLSASELLAGMIECDENDADSAADKLLGAHISTRERLPDREEFIRAINKFIRPGDIVADVGCGFAPLLYPAEFFRSLSCYIAVDKDTEATETVRVFAKKRGISNLRAYTWDISSGLEALRSLTGIKKYDIALMLKLIPVVSRADRAIGAQSRFMQVLGDFPAPALLATASRVSMTKYESIEKRELSALRKFAGSYSFDIVSEFSCGSETGFCLRKR